MQANRTEEKGPTMEQSAGGPTLKPPGIGDGGDRSSISMPTISDAAAAGAMEAAPTGPMAQPPGQAVGTGALAVTGVWHTGVSVDALWAINQPRNAFMHVVGIGWKKIYSATDAAFTALTTLASQARQTGRTISYREEADGMVHEIFLW